MIHKLVKWAGILVLLLFSSNPALAAENRTPINVGTIQAVKSENYTNPLPIQVPGDGRVESCADPTILHGTEVTRPATVSTSISFPCFALQIL